MALQVYLGIQANLRPHQWHCGQLEPLHPSSALCPQAPSPIKRTGRGARGARTVHRSAVLEQEVVEEELRPARATGRGRARAAAAAEAEPAGSEDEEEGSERQQGSLLGSILRSAKKAVSRGQRGEAGEEDEHGEQLGCSCCACGEHWWWWHMQLTSVQMYRTPPIARVHPSVPGHPCR